MMAVHCDREGCDEISGCYNVTVPNPDRGWCMECHQQIGDLTITYHFCCMGHLITWISDNYRDIIFSDGVQSSTPKANENE